MSQMGQKRKSRPCGEMSAAPPTADIVAPSGSLHPHVGHRSRAVRRDRRAGGGAGDAGGGLNLHRAYCLPVLFALSSQSILSIVFAISRRHWRHRCIQLIVGTKRLLVVERHLVCCINIALITKRPLDPPEPRPEGMLNYGALNSHGSHGSTVSIANANCVASHASKILRSDCDKTTRRANHPKPCPALSEKIFHLSRRANQ
jgi:hypothetical protein